MSGLSEAELNRIARNRETAKRLRTAKLLKNTKTNKTDDQSTSNSDQQINK